jgi:MFS family permease
MPPFHQAARALSPLMIGVALLLLGTGLLNTLLAVRAQMAGLSSTLLGLVMSAYFVGFILGTYLAPHMIRRVGHIRSFAICAAVAASAVILHAIHIDPLFWMLLRALTGMSLVGLYAVIESWLAAYAHGSERGRVFALYMVVNLLALAAGQFLILVAPLESFVLFGLIAILINGSLIPVALTRLEQPPLPLSPQLRIRHMVHAAPSAVAGALGSGLAMGAFWGMAPAYAQSLGGGAEAVALFMSTAILGGAALQWPLGRLSDGHDRRETLRSIALAAALVALLCGALGHWWPESVAVLMFLYGGLVFAVYPIAMAHLSDRIASEELLEGAGVMLLLHGVGAAFGPTLAGLVMSLLSPGGLFAYFLACWLLLSGFLQWRLIREREQAPVGDLSTFVPMLRTSPVLLELLTEELPPPDLRFADLPPPDPD